MEAGAAFPETVGCLPWPGWNEWTDDASHVEKICCAQTISTHLVRSKGQKQEAACPTYNRGNSRLRKEVRIVEASQKCKPGTKSGHPEVRAFVSRYLTRISTCNLSTSARAVQKMNIGGERLDLYLYLMPKQAWHGDGRQIAEGLAARIGGPQSFGTDYTTHGKPFGK